MSRVDQQALESSLDQAFERQLLESARSDGVPAAEVQAAWARFAGAATALTTLAASTHVARGAQVGAKLAIAKWLIIGACCGGSLTAIWLGSTPSTTGGHVPALARSAALAKRADSAAGAAPVVEAPSGSGASAAATPSQSTLRDNPGTSHSDLWARAVRTGADERLSRGRAAAHALGSAAAPEPVPEPRATRVSTLGAEVSLLDAARSASLGGQALAALRLIDDYHRQYPAGELSRDAEVVALDALAAEHSARLVERATRFLDAYPNDPQSAHVKQLLRAR
jgi:hypothetical protein